MARPSGCAEAWSSALTELARLVPEVCGGSVKVADRSAIRAYEYGCVFAADVLIDGAITDFKAAPRNRASSSSRSASGVSPQTNPHSMLCFSARTRQMCRPCCTPLAKIRTACGPSLSPRSPRTLPRPAEHCHSSFPCLCSLMHEGSIHQSRIV